MEPQRRSRNTGITGTAARRAISSKPRRNSIRTPVRLICPSGKTHTRSPAASRSTTCLTAVVAWRGATEITPVTRNASLIHQDCRSPANARNRRGRGLASCRMTAST